MYPSSIGFIGDILLLSVCLTEPTLYESNTSYIFVSFLHVASNMFKKVERKSANVRKALILIFLTFAIASTRYVVLILSNNFPSRGWHHVITDQTLFHFITKCTFYWLLH